MSAEQEPLPAWSLPADAVDRIALPETWPGRVTREWAWGGATGAGVRVCVLDSGVELDHSLVGEVQQSIAISIQGDEVIVLSQTGLLLALDKKNSHCRQWHRLFSWS